MSEKIALSFSCKNDLMKLAEKVSTESGLIAVVGEKPDDSWGAGFAAAVKAIAEKFNDDVIYRHQEKMYRLEDADRQLREYFGITDDAEEEDLPACYAKLEENIGATYEEATDPNSGSYILDYLVERFADEFDCNVAENDIWQSVIQSFINDGGVHQI